MAVDAAAERDLPPPAAGHPEQPDDAALTVGAAREEGSPPSTRSETAFLQAPSARVEFSDGISVEDVLSVQTPQVEAMPWPVPGRMA